MGNFMGKAMEENFKKTTALQLEMQQTMLERQMAMQNEMRERQMAMMVARSRDFFWYFITFDTLVTLGLTAGFLKKRKPGILIPLVPLSFVAVYQWDMAYGPKMNRLREMADRIIDEENSLLDLPHGMPTFQDIEAARLKQKS